MEIKINNCFRGGGRGGLEEGGGKEKEKEKEDEKEKEKEKEDGRENEDVLYLR